MNEAEKKDCMNGVFIDEKYYRFLIMKETTPIHTHPHIYGARGHVWNTFLFLLPFLYFVLMYFHLNQSL